MPAPRPPATSIDRPAVTSWVESYLVAWHSNDPADIRRLFTQSAEYHEMPYDTHWIGRAAIVTGWRSRWHWQQGGWSFDWDVVSIEGRTAVVSGVGHYTELGDFNNIWTVSFDGFGRCTRFDMVNTELNIAIS
jgi:hypothetical protein